MAIKRQGITATDIAACEKLFVAKGFDMQDAVFAFNYTEDRWEVLFIEKASRPKVLADSWEGWDGSNHRD